MVFSTGGIGATPDDHTRQCAAQALGRSGDVGTLAVGQYGDIIAVAGDPRADVTELTRVRVVIKGGAVVRDDSAAKGK